MKVFYQSFDYGFGHAWATRRGPFRHGVRTLGSRARRVSMPKRRKAIRTLQAWARTTTSPRNRLGIIRRRR